MTYTEIEPKKNDEQKQELSYQIPYSPVQLSSPEFRGTPNYEVGITGLIRKNGKTCSTKAI
jgi:hypothetical protein